VAQRFDRLMDAGAHHCFTAGIAILRAKATLCEERSLFFEWVYRTELSFSLDMFDLLRNTCELASDYSAL